MPKTKCYPCGGSGKIGTIGEEICSYCVGTGRDKNSILWAEPCRNCNGKGRVPYSRKVVCNSCHGTGWNYY